MIKHEKTSCFSNVSLKKRFILSIKSMQLSAFCQAFLITSIYFILGCTWIVFTDIITSNKFGETSIALNINITKGIVYVAISSALIFSLVYPAIRKLVILKKSLQSTNKRLEQTLTELYSEIDKSKLIEKMLTETQKHAHVGSFDFEITSGLLKCSDEALKICGINRESFCGTLKELSQRIFPDDKEKGLQICRQAIVEKRVLEFDCNVSTSDVEGRIICARFAPIYDEKNTCVRILGTVHDITARRKAEILVEKERNRAQMYLDLAGSIFVAIDENTVVTLVNQAGCKLLCYPKDEILGKNWPDNFVFGPCKAKFQAAHEKLRSAKDSDYLFHENSVITGCGEERIISWKLVSIHDEKGNYTGIIASGVDITEQRRALKALSESEKSKSLLLSHLPAMAYRCCFDENWTMKYLSEGCNKLTGYWPENFINNLDLSYNDIISPEYQISVYQDIFDAISKKDSYQLEYIIITATGEKKRVLEIGQGIFDRNDNLEALDGIVIDITKVTIQSPHLC